jgi:myo-inositol-1(or 4)-monophosphatase
MNDFLTFAVQIAQEAGEILKLAQTQTISIEEKRANDLVTEFDQRIDDFLSEKILSQFPNHQILAEESGTRGDGSDFCWVIDPIDGTTNFAHHIPMFAISIALQYKNQTIVGVVYNPMNGELFTAQKNHGAFLNGQRLQINPQATIQGALLATGFPCKDPDDVPAYMAMFEPLLQASQGIRRIGAASLDLAYVAAGRFDGFWEIALKPWDIAAASLMISEAGGVVTDLIGGSDFPGKGVLAGNSALCLAIQTVIQPVISTYKLF